MERRTFLLSAAAATAIPTVAKGQTGPAPEPGSGAYYVDPVRGNDANAGSREAPFRTLPHAAEVACRLERGGPVTILLTDGVHVVDRTVRLAAPAGRFTASDRLTIRALMLPGEPGWHIGLMPTLINTMPLQPEWNGRTDPLGGAADGILVGTSHVTIQGLRILGMPVIETPRPGLIKRLYSISRLDRSLEDLQIRQCVFLGDEFIVPSHVAIIALGSGLQVDQCVFRGLKIAAVFWQGGSSGHAMRRCICDSLYGSSVWTSGIASDFDYSDNVVTNCNYVWTNQSASSAAADEGARTLAAAEAPALTYQVNRCYLANNRRLAGSGTGARLEYEDIDPGFMIMNETTVVNDPVRLVTDTADDRFLSVSADSPAAAIKAGLFA